MNKFAAPYAYIYRESESKIRKLTLYTLPENIPILPLSDVVLIIIGYFNRCEIDCLCIVVEIKVYKMKSLKIILILTVQNYCM